MGWWVTEALEVGGRVFLVSWIVWVIGSVVLHELAHGWAALWQGDDTPRTTGHMTWNPIVHMGMWSFIAFAILGIAWGAMPVDRSNFRSRYGDAMVSFAGPAMNLLLALACVTLLVVWNVAGTSAADHVQQNVRTFLFVGAMLNFVLMMFNLIPVPPLDGGHILANFFPGFARLWEGERGAVIGLIVFFMLFAYAGRLIWPVAIDLVRTLEGALSRVI